MSKLKKQKLDKPVDIRGNDGTGWLYSDVVKDHFFNPRKFMQYGEEDEFKFNGMGRVGSPACGDEMVMWIQVDEKKAKIKDCRWRTFGCGSAIASTSALAEMITEKDGMDLKKAQSLKPQNILKKLGGLPDKKIHCSVLGDKALLSAINDYYRRTGQHDKVITKGSKVVDKDLNITDKDIEEAVLEGAQNLEDVQKKLKVGVVNKESIPEIEELIHFYSEKYYG